MPLLPSFPTLPHRTLAIACTVVLASGCKAGVTPPTAFGVTERHVVAQQPGTSGKTAAGDRTFILTDRDGKPFDGVVASIGGASLPIQQGVLTVPGDVLARAGAAGTLRLYVPGYVPKTPAQA